MQCKLLDIHWRWGAFLKIHKAAAWKASLLLISTFNTHPNDKTSFSPIQISASPSLLPFKPGQVAHERMVTLDRDEARGALGKAIGPWWLMTGIVTSGMNGFNGTEYPLVNIQKAIENHNFNRWTIYKWAIFHSYVSLPEGIWFNGTWCASLHQWNNWTHPNVLR